MKLFRSEKSLNNANKALLYLGLILVILFAVPILSSIIVHNIGELAGCSLTAAKPTECIVFGIDFGERFYSYQNFWFATLFTPILFIVYFWDIILVWLAMYLLLLINRWKLRYGS